MPSKTETDEPAELIAARVKLAELQQKARDAFTESARAQADVNRQQAMITEHELSLIGIKGRRSFTYHQGHDGYAAGIPGQIETEWELTLGNKWQLVAVQGIPIPKGTNVDEAEANGKLMKAAPQLLAALRELGAYLDFTEPWEDESCGFTDASGINAAFEKAIAAIAAATGEGE